MWENMLCQTSERDVVRTEVSLAHDPSHQPSGSVICHCHPEDLLRNRSNVGVAHPPYVEVNKENTRSTETASRSSTNPTSPWLLWQPGWHANWTSVCCYHGNMLYRKDSWCYVAPPEIHLQSDCPQWQTNESAGADGWRGPLRLRLLEKEHTVFAQINEWRMLEHDSLLSPTLLPWILSQRSDLPLLVMFW